ncbi:hypothetical protein P9112_001819 [Eukaryota sp. TZLM1-RC]
MPPVFQLKSLDELQRLAQSVQKTTQQSNNSRTRSPVSTNTNNKSPVSQTPSFRKKPLIRARRSSKSPTCSASPSRARSVSPLRSPPKPQPTLTSVAPSTNIATSPPSPAQSTTEQTSPQPPFSPKTDSGEPPRASIVIPSPSPESVAPVNSPTPFDQPSTNPNPNPNPNSNPKSHLNLSPPPSAGTESTSPIDVLYRCLSPSSRHLLSATESALAKLPVSGDDPPDLESRLWNELETSTFRLSKTNPNPNCKMRPMFTMRTRMDSVSQEVQTETMTSCDHCNTSLIKVDYLQKELDHLSEKYNKCRTELDEIVEMGRNYWTVRVSADLEKFKKPKSQFTSPTKPTLKLDLAPKPRLTLDQLEAEESKFIGSLFDG